MWNDQKSLALTRWCVRLFALALAAADLGGYWLVRWYMSWNTETIGQGLREGLMMMASLYLCSLPAWAALYWLHRLLGSIAVPPPARCAWPAPSIMRPGGWPVWPPGLWRCWCGSSKTASSRPCA